MLFAVGIGSIVLGLSEGANWHWGSPAVIGLLAGGAVLTLGSLLRSRRDIGAGRPSALELDLYANRHFALAGLGSALFGAALYAWLLAGPLFVVTFWDYSVLKSGLSITPGAVTAAIASVAVGRRATPKAQFLAVVLGSALFAAVGAFMAATLGHELGGAVGVAIMAVLLTGDTPDPLGKFLDVYWFCAIAAFGAMLAGVLLRFVAPSAPRNADVRPRESVGAN